MVKKLSISGNELNWENVLTLENHIEELELALFNGEVVLDEEGNIDDNFYEQITDSNPTIIYYNKEIDIQSMFKEGKKIHDLVDWYIVHETNGNFVTVVGEFPEEYLVAECFQVEAV